MNKLKPAIRPLFLTMVLVAMSSALTAQSDANRLNVMSCGAVNDTHVVSTQAIQKAIDSCYFQGGGVVYFPPGHYTTGTIVLKKNVTLHLEKDATLYASQDIQDYRMPLEDAVRPMLIYANGAQNIAITGKGQIHGRAQHTYEDLKATDKFIETYIENARNAGVEMKRYYSVAPDVGLVTFSNCSNIRVENVSLVESQFWTLHFVRCEDIHVKGVEIYSSLEKGVNADGIDINSCKNVDIANCQVTTGDDAIVLKSWYKDPCENISVSNCTLSSSSTALKIGTESHGDFKHISFTNCKIKDSNRGLSIVVRDGALVEDVLFSNIQIECSRRHFNWWGNADPIWIYLTKKSPKSPVGLIKDVTFQNISARGMGTSRIESTEGMRIENIKLMNVDFFMSPESKPDKRADHAFYANNVKNLHLMNVRIDWDKEQVEKNWKSALAFSQVESLQIQNFYGRQGLKDSDSAVIDLVNTQNAILENCQAKGQPNVFVKVSGQDSKAIRMHHIDGAKNARNKLLVDESVMAKSSIKLIDP